MKVIDNIPGLNRIGEPAINILSIYTSTYYFAPPYLSLNTVYVYNINILSAVDFLNFCYTIFLIAIFMMRSLVYETYLSYGKI